MVELPGLGRILIIVGLAIVLLGVLLLVAPRVPLLGRLPGDIRIERDGVTILIPLGSMILISVVLSVLVGLAGRFGR